MKVLVTGVTGFIGGNLARELVGQGYRVRGLARPGRDVRPLRMLGMEVAWGDVTDRPSVERALEGCRAVFHVAAAYSYWVTDIEGMYETNVNGTENVLYAALEKGVERAVYTSTCATVGLPGNGDPGNEATHLDLDELVGHYKRSKYMAEVAALEVCRAGLPVVVVNPTTPIGAGDCKPTPTGRIVVDYLRGRMPAYVDTGLNVVDVEDVARGHILALEKGMTGERYLLGNRNLSLREIFCLLEKITGIKAPSVRIPVRLALAAAYVDEFLARRIPGRTPRLEVAAVKLARKHMYFDPSKAVRELGLSQTPVELAFEKAAHWFWDHGYAPAPSQPVPIAGETA